MGSKQKETVLVHKNYFEKKLQERRALLAEQGLAAAEIEKDTRVKEIRAKMRKMNAKLKVIAAIGMRTEELAKMKADRQAGTETKKEGKEKESQKAAEKGKEKKKKKKEAAAETESEE
ncbi:MAG: hypothetical protein JXO48_11295 [Deltaproteobacteria bacterium]|nr:hypothetical protein [Deltaproteobacteria bacterium]